MPDQTTGPPASGPPLPESPAAPDRSTLDKPDRFAAFCTYAVGIGAAIVSFSGWTDLAEMAGFNQHAMVQVSDGITVPVRMAWLFPVLVDAYAIGATRVWLNDRAATTKETRTYARRSALGATALTIVGNAVVHGLAAIGPLTGLWYALLAVCVGAIPPVMLGLDLHLLAMCSRDAKATANHPAGPPAKPKDTDQSTSPVQTTRPKKPVRTKPADKPVREQPTDRADLDRIREQYPDRSPGRNQVMDFLGCGTTKADRLLQLLDREEVTA